MSGEVDMATSPKLREIILSLVEEGRRRLLVDLRKVGFLDSSGLGVLVGALKRLRENGGELSLVCPNGPVSKVLSITGLDRVFTIHRDPAEVVGT